LPAHVLVVTVALFLIAENTISPHLRYVADGRLWRAGPEDCRLNRKLLVPAAEVADQNGQPYLSPLWKTLVERSRVAEGLQLIHWLYLRGTWREFGEEAAEILRHNYRFNLDRMEEIGQRSHFRVYEIIPVEIIDGSPRRVFSPLVWRADRLLDIYP